MENNGEGENGGRKSCTNQCRLKYEAVKKKKTIGHCQLTSALLVSCIIQEQDGVPANTWDIVDIIVKGK